jgi:hypothetical protein
MHNFFLVYFVNLYMFRVYLGPSSGGTTVCIQQLVLIILFIRLCVVHVGLELIPIQVVHKVGFSLPDSSWVSQFPTPHADQLSILGKAALPHHQIRTSAASVHTLIRAIWFPNFSFSTPIPAIIGLPTPPVISVYFCHNFHPSKTNSWTTSSVSPTSLRL